MELNEKCQMLDDYPLPDEENRIGYQLKTLDRLFHRQLEAGMRAAGTDGMSVMNGWIIMYLSQNEGKDIFQKDIERKFNVGKSSVAGTLKMMEEKGYVVRQPVKEDARLKKVCLTDKGRMYIHKMEQGRLEVEEKARKDLTRDEMDMFFRIVKKMKDNLSDEKEMGKC